MVKHYVKIHDVRYFGRDGVEKNITLLFNFDFWH